MMGDEMMGDEVMSGEVMGDEVRRARIGRLLADGLATEVRPRPQTSEDAAAIVTRLRTEASDDLERKLVVAGFTDHPVEAADATELCATCMYYQIHRRHCDLPELQLPVQPRWSCRLWRL